MVCSRLYLSIPTPKICPHFACFHQREHNDMAGTFARAERRYINITFRTIIVKYARPQLLMPPRFSRITHNKGRSYRTASVVWIPVGIFGAIDGTWTRTRLRTRPSNVRVCQFRHDRMLRFHNGSYYTRWSHGLSTIKFHAINFSCRSVTHR